MTRRRWIADEFSASESRAALLGDNAAHLARTLRARPGQEFEIACDGVIRRGIVSSVRDDRVEFELHEEITAEATIPITLLLAIFKFDRMEWAIEKCTELNVASIVPVIARRTEKHLTQAAERRVERWRRIVREAAQQSRRVAAPEIERPVKLGDALAQQAELNVVLSEIEQQSTLPSVLRNHVGAGSLALAIGPEGGWTSEELSEFSRAGWFAASLGNTILRAETAAIAAMAICQASLK